MGRLLPRTGLAGRTGWGQCDWRAIAHGLLRVAGFAATTLLLTWGLFVLFFVALGGFSFDGLMHHLANVTSRYVVAGPERTASFKHLIAAAHLIVTAGLVVLRHGALFPATTIEGTLDHG